jgi:hypothetical protein
VAVGLCPQVVPRGPIGPFLSSVYYYVEHGKDTHQGCAFEAAPDVLYLSADCARLLMRIPQQEQRRACGAVSSARVVGA